MKLLAAILIRVSLKFKDIAPAYVLWISGKQKSPKRHKSVQIWSRQISTSNVPKLLFEQPVDIRSDAFYSTPFGHLYQCIPFDNLAKQIPATEEAASGQRM